ncbi:TetR/AcrR family transcriptional regulator [Curtobacterium sp. MCBA15_001]|uniref:TetR/AcrR family transcriptional regulator n=1 Tax=Curtobacterium sp. MCBA15_001 TaxID=1898731 RepID=UPI0008DD3A11|nr:TetR/AcrR family transcriptional regulator [Curtobacterium sp. MCBA15_001]OIH93731.1 TetR family transcriptional regulator [Curtobacterium sp. MCBA15_001]
MPSRPPGPGSTATEQRIIDIAVEVLGARPDAGMADVAAAAGVVRRTVYGYFPTRADLVAALARRAVDEIGAVLTTATSDATAPADTAATGDAVPADAAWAQFVTELWPVAHRYRVLLVLRRGEYGADIHALLRPVEDRLGELVRRGQQTGTFGDHLPADVLAQLAWSAVFTIADGDRADRPVEVAAAVRSTLLVLGVAPDRARALAEVDEH